MTSQQPLTMETRPKVGTGRIWFGPALAVALLVVALLYTRILAEMFKEWWRTPTLWHGFVVIAFAAFLVARKRRSFMEMPLALSRSGLLIVAGRGIEALSALIAVAAIYGYLFEKRIVLKLAGRRYA